MAYVCTYHPHRPSGMTLYEMYDKWTLGLIRIIKSMERKGLYGEEHSFTKDTVIEWLEQIGLKEKFIYVSDKVHRDYRWWLHERLYQNVWHNRIRKTDDIVEDSDNQYQGVNPFYLPEIVTLDGVGHIITEQSKYIDVYKNQRDNKLLAQQKILEKRCIDNLDFIKQLPPHKTDFLPNKDDKDNDVV